MRDYAKVSPQFWTRGSGKRLRGDADAQVLALYLVTCPSANMVGVYYVPFVSIAHETGLGIERTQKAIAALQEAEFAYYDEDAELAWVPNMAAYQIGEELKEGDKRRGGPIRAEIEKVGAHRFAVEFWKRYGAGYGLGPCPYDIEETDEEAPRDEPLARGSEGPSKGLQPHSGRAGAGEEQEQEQEQERVQGEPERDSQPVTSSPAATDAHPPESKPNPTKADPVRLVFDHWLKGYRHRHPKARDRKPTDKERKAIKAALGLGYSADDLKLAVEGLFFSPFHTGENDRRTEYLEVGIAFRERNLEAFREAALARRAALEEERKRAAEPRASDEDVAQLRNRREAMSGRFRVPAPATAPPSPDETETQPQLALGGAQ